MRHHNEKEKYKSWILKECRLAPLLNVPINVEFCIASGEENLAVTLPDLMFDVLIKMIKDVKKISKF